MQERRKHESLLLGIEIGGTKLQVGLGSRDGAIADVERMRVEVGRGAEQVLAQVAAGFERLLERQRVRRSDIAAAGAGFGGPVDAVAGRVALSHQVEGWNGFPLRDWMIESLGVARAVVHNDSDAAALAEALFGAGRGASPVLYVNSGSGVGGGLIVDGRIYRGGSGIGALEFGHLLVDLPETRVTIEELASGWSIGRRAQEAFQAMAGEPDGPLARLAAGDLRKIDSMSVATAAAEGDELALRILAQATTAVARGLAHAVTLLAPQVVVLGGGVSLMPDRLWMDPIRRELLDRVFPPFRDRFRLSKAALGENVVVHGALALAGEAL